MRSCLKNTRNYYALLGNSDDKVDSLLKELAKLGDVESLEILGTDHENKGEFQQAEEIIYYIDSGHLLDPIQHPNTSKYAGQRFYVVDVDGYVY